MTLTQWPHQGHDISQIHFYNVSTGCQCTSFIKQWKILPECWKLKEFIESKTGWKKKKKIHVCKEHDLWYGAKFHFCTHADADGGYKVVLMSNWSATLSVWTFEQGNLLELVVGF